MYLFTNRWVFKVIDRKELEVQMKEVRMSAMDSPSASYTSDTDKDPAKAATKPLSGQPCLQAS